MEKSAESQTVSPGTGEIGHTHARISGGRSSGPSQEGLARCDVRFLTDYDVGYLQKRKILKKILKDNKMIKASFKNMQH
jgi:hypothetical protein